MVATNSLSALSVATHRHLVEQVVTNQHEDNNHWENSRLGRSLGCPRQLRLQGKARLRLRHSRGSAGVPSCAPLCVVVVHCSVLVCHGVVCAPLFTTFRWAPLPRAHSLVIYNHSRKLLTFGSTLHILIRKG